jgi:hypothetical protein
VSAWGQLRNDRRVTPKPLTHVPTIWKRIQFDATFSVFISLSMKTISPSERIAPDHEVLRNDTPKEMAHDGMGGRNPRSSVMPK